MSCFGGAVLDWPRGSPPCGSAWCVLVFRCPVLCSVARCCRVVVCCCALRFVCVVACACCLFLAAARLLCVFWGVVLCVPCRARSLCCARGLCCFWWLVLLVPGVAACCWGSAGGSGCPALSFGAVCQLWCPCPVWPSLGVFSVVSCSPVLCPVALCCRVVLCCGALSSSFVFLPAGGADFRLFPVGSGLRASSGSFLSLCSAFAVLCWCACVVALCSVLSCPRGASCCFVLLPVVFVCLPLNLAVLCCLPVGPGCSWCRVLLASCGVSLGAVLRRVAARCAAGVALLCAVLFPFAPFGAAAHCVVSWGAVCCHGVLCFLAPCFVLSPRAVCVLLWCVAAWCCSPSCSVPCAPWGVVLYVSCRLRPVRCCCVARSPSVPCSPVVCPVVPCCRVVPWCPVLPPCWVRFLRGCGCTYLKNRCKMC